MIQTIQGKLTFSSLPMMEAAASLLSATGILKVKPGEPEDSADVGSLTTYGFDYEEPNVMDAVDKDALTITIPYDTYEAKQFLLVRISRLATKAELFTFSENLDSVHVYTQNVHLCSENEEITALLNKPGPEGWEAYLAEQDEAVMSDMLDDEAFTEALTTQCTEAWKALNEIALSADMQPRMVSAGVFMVDESNINASYGDLSVWLSSQHMTRSIVSQDDDGPTYYSVIDIALNLAESLGSPNLSGRTGRFALRTIPVSATQLFAYMIKFSQPEKIEYMYEIMDRLMSDERVKTYVKNLSLSMISEDVMQSVIEEAGYSDDDIKAMLISTYGSIERAIEQQSCVLYVDSDRHEHSGYTICVHDEADSGVYEAEKCMIISEVNDRVIN